MIDLDNVDIDSFKDKLDEIKGIMETKESIAMSQRDAEVDLASILGVNKKKIKPIIRMLLNLQTEGEAVDEELLMMLRIYIQRQRLANERRKF
jgi:GTPase